MDNRSREEWISHLHGCTRKELKHLFNSLPVPEINEFHGEFEGILLSQGNALTNRVTAFFINKEGAWLGKAFKPLNSDVGNGYNIFRTRNGVRRTLRMHLRRRESAHGERVAIEYSELNDGIVGGIYDDLKRVTPGLFLGIGTVPLGGRLLPRLKRRVMFALSGPTGEFLDDAEHQDLFIADDDVCRAA